MTHLTNKAMTCRKLRKMLAKELLAIRCQRQMSKDEREWTTIGIKTAYAHIQVEYLAMIRRMADE